MIVCLVIDMLYIFATKDLLLVCFVSTLLSVKALIYNSS